MEKKIESKIVNSGWVLGIATIIPGSLLSVLGLFTIGVFYFAIPAIAFWLTSKPLFKNNSNFHKYEILFPIAVGILSGIWYYQSWLVFDPKWRSIYFFIAAIVINTFIIGYLWVLFWRGINKPTLKTRWIYNWILWYWFFSWAFVWTGEAP